MFPSLDFSRFREPSSSEEFCREFVSALKEYGFVKLINHGIPSTQMDQAFTAVGLHSSIVIWIYIDLIIDTPLLPAAFGTEVEITSSSHRASPSGLQSGWAGEHWGRFQLW